MTTCCLDELTYRAVKSAARWSTPSSPHTARPIALPQGAPRSCQGLRRRRSHAPPLPDWKSFYYLLEDAGFELMLVNSRHVKSLPGRKSDVSDAALLAQLGAHGLVRGSFVPPEPIRQLRDLTRTRTAITRERGRELQRLEMLLEDAGIKLSAVATVITGVSGRAMLEALIAGERDPAARLRWPNDGYGTRSPSSPRL